MLYGTTRDFLRVFGLSGIDDLPEVEGLPREAAHRPRAVEPIPEDESTEEPSVVAEDASPSPGGTEPSDD